MRKIFGLKLGGLHQKIFNIVLIFVIVITAVFGTVSLCQYSLIDSVVSRAREEQQNSITAVSQETMKQVIDGSMTKTNALQAYIAGDLFKDLKNDVLTLKILAAGLFEHNGNFEPHGFNVPDAAEEGTPTAQILWESGVDYASSEYLGIAAHMTDTLLAMYSSTELMNSCYIGLADGTYLCVDEHPANKFDENGNIISFPVRERPWYEGAVSSGGLWFSDVYADSFTGDLCITCSAPVYAGGETVGVVGADLFLGAIEEYINASVGNGGFLCIVNGDGHTIFAPENNGIFTVEASESAEDLRKSDEPSLAAFVADALAGPTGLRTVGVKGRSYYMAGTPIDTVGWTVISAVEKAVTEQPTALMISEYDRINDEATVSFREGSAQVQFTAVIVLAAVMFLGMILVVRAAGRIVDPIERMTANIIESGNTGKMFELDDVYRTGDEIEVLAEAFDDLSKKTKQYIHDITEITKEKERIGTELELARKIQADMLPNIFPAYPDRPEFDIYASMDPAKEVGGDFYDFFLIDDDHLGMVMADVSGKGVPAALFMMMSKILIHNFAMMNGSPAKVLEQTNSTICQNNEEEMFVTVWFGVLEISTGMITASNAGHEFPVIRRPEGDFEIFNDKHGFVIGALDGMKYSEYQMKLEKGGTIFLYTDGVPEATDANDELYGTDRLLEEMNRCKNCSPEDMLKNIRRSIDEFVGEADQFDDLTMLALTLI